MNRGSAILVAGAVGAVVLPALAFGAHLPLWIDGAVSLLAFGGTYLVVRRPKPGEGLDEDQINEARNQTGLGLAADGATALSRLQRAAKFVKDADMRQQLGALGVTAQKVLNDVKADPYKAMAVRRLMTFYLPNAASLAEGWQSLEQRSTPSPERVTQTRETVKALNEAFAKFADDLVEPQMQTLDLDLKVLNDALKSDLEKT